MAAVPTSSSPQQTLFFRSRRKPSCRTRQFRPWRRRRSKFAGIAVRNQIDPSSLTPFPSPLGELLNGFLSHLPHPLNSLGFVPLTALGFASGLALSLPKPYFDRRSLRTSQHGECILITSPTPFNRFVLLRCPLISFVGAELLEDVNEKLVKEERHFVRLDGGTTPAPTAERRGVGAEKELEYSRVCVGTEDGGVITLDWPAMLDLSEEHGLDSTVLLVPGSAEGSMEQNVRDLVRQCLSRGLFPVVMNPRGCAGSPLTTPRLFSAADSGDISSAVQFLSRKRPWSTFMAVGWGYGANMLTKYLAEVGEKTHLTAATCIDNPFDLEEVTRTSSRHAAISHKLTGGLIDILKSNKGLFQGRNKDFDVRSALSAKSVRDFDTAISMISYGFKTIEEFYSMSSTRSMVGNLKIPVLFIQSDDKMVPLYSVPRGLIAENPFTSLLICSSSPSDVVNKSLMMWSQELTIEWLMAVEFALLKGRHPLLEDVDVTINPSKGLALSEGRISATGDERDSVLNLRESDTSRGYLLKSVMDVVPNNHATGLQLTGESSHELHGVDIRQVNGVPLQSSSVGADLAEEEPNDVVKDDKGQVLQTAKVAMNVLDVTMPGTLNEEDKKKVLDAINRGETLVKALEAAVPEDVRGKLTSAVSGILQAQGKNLKFDVPHIGQTASLPSDLIMKMNSNQRKKPNDGNGDRSHQSSEAPESPRDIADGSSNVRDAADGSAGGADEIVQSPEESIKSNDGSDDSGRHSSEKRNSHDSADGSNNIRGTLDKGAGASDDIIQSEDKSLKSFASDDPRSLNGGSSVRKGTDEPQNNNHDNESTQGDVAPLAQDSDDQGGALPTLNSSSQREQPPDSEEGMIKQGNRCKDDESVDSEAKGSNAVGEAKPADSSADKSKTGLHKSGDEGGLQSNLNSLDSEPIEKQDSQTENKDEGTTQLNPDENKPSSDTKASTFNVSQAFDALTGLDDSTQLAVNSVFGVMEEIINQLDEKEDNTTEREENDSRGDLVDRQNHVEKAKDGNGSEEVRPSIDVLSIDDNDGHSGLEGNAIGVSDVGVNEGNSELAARKPLPKGPNKHEDMRDLHALIASKTYAEDFDGDYLQQCIQSKIKRDDRHLDLDTTTSLFLDYIPEEGQWKLLEQPGSNMDFTVDETPQAMPKRKPLSSVAKGGIKNKFIEPSYVIRDSGNEHKPLDAPQKLNKLTGGVFRSSSRPGDLAQSVKNIVLDSLKVEVSRKLSGDEEDEMKLTLAREIEDVANSVSLAIEHDTVHTWCLNSDIGCSPQQGNKFDGGRIIEAISSSIKGKGYLRRILPVGVVVGSTLASLRKYLNVAVVHHDFVNEDVILDEGDIESTKSMIGLVEGEVVDVPASKGYEDYSYKQPVLTSDSKLTSVETANKGDADTPGSGALSGDTMMIGAVTAALGASAFLQQQQPYQGKNEVNTRGATPSMPLEKMKHLKKCQTAVSEDVADDSNQNTAISLAEKAMSVAAPIVPTKEDGEVDQERLVAMLTEVGQKGGVLRLVGKFALLWGGIRGALSLTNRLISFLRIAERPLYQRMLAFACMVLILWSPVAVPLLPTLMQNWAANQSSPITELVCTFGLYTAIAVLILLWGKRIRGYENALKRYGLDLTSPQKVREVVIGLTGGILLVLSIHSVNAVLGFVHLSWPSSSGSSPLYQLWMNLIILSGQGLVTAIIIASVEELFFRSWLAEEIAIDLGYYRGIILSGLAFSICQRSLQAIPGLWLLALCLTGAKQRNQGSLYSPIGLHAGIMASCFVLQKGGFLTYTPGFPLWMTGTHPFQPFSGIVGLVFSLLLAALIYPRQLNLGKEMTAPIRE